MATSVPIYEWLINKLEDFQKATKKADIKKAIDIGLEKLRLYYARTDDSSMYSITTSK